MFIIIKYLQTIMYIIVSFTCGIELHSMHNTLWNLNAFVNRLTTRLYQPKHKVLWQFCVCDVRDMLKDRRYNTYVPRFGKTEHIVTTSETAFISPYHRYLHIPFKTQWQNNKRWPGLLFYMALSLLCKMLKASTNGEGPLGAGIGWHSILH